MASRIDRGSATRDDAMAAFEVEGCSAPRSWANGPGDRYDWHDHRYRKVVYCLAGSITFHTDHGDMELQAGDRLDLDPRTRQAATVGPGGCACLEATAPPSATS